MTTEEENGGRESRGQHQRSCIGYRLDVAGGVARGDDHGQERQHLQGKVDDAEGAEGLGARSEIAGESSAVEINLCVCTRVRLTRGQRAQVMSTYMLDAVAKAHKTHEDSERREPVSLYRGEKIAPRQASRARRTMAFGVDDDLPWRAISTTR
jgi:hypothetical protein